MSQLPDALRELLQVFAASLTSRLEDGSASVVVFGPGARAAGAEAPETAPRPSQIDILVVARELPPSRWDRHDLVYEALLDLEDRRDRFAAATGWWPYFAVHMKTVDELRESGPLLSAFGPGTWRVSDPGDTFETWHRGLRRSRDESGVRAVGSGDRIYWDADPGERGGEAVPDRFKELSRSYLKQAESRMLVTRLALEQKNFAYVVRAAHEAVELSLKAMLAHVGFDPPHWHDVGREIREQASRLPGIEPSVAEELAAISSKLREHRETSVYGDRLDKLPPDRLFSEYDAKVSRDWARQVFEIALQTINRLSL